MKITFPQLARFIWAGQKTGRAYLVGIDGLSGAGKATFSERLSRAIANEGYPYSIIPMADLYSPDLHEKEAAPLTADLTANGTWQERPDPFRAVLIRNPRLRDLPKV